MIISVKTIGQNPNKTFEGTTTRYFCFNFMKSVFLFQSQSKTALIAGLSCPPLLESYNQEQLFSPWHSEMFKEGKHPKKLPLVTCFTLSAFWDSALGLETAVSHKLKRKVTVVQHEFLFLLTR